MTGPDRLTVAIDYALAHDVPVVLDGQLLTPDIVYRGDPHRTWRIGRDDGRWVAVTALEVTR